MGARKVNQLLLVDTDILIDVARGVSEAVKFIEEKSTQAELAVSVITEMELVVGCRNRGELRDTEKFLKRFTVIQLSNDISVTASKLLKGYRLSHGLLIADALIAATALKHNLYLATKNQRDFRYIEGLLLTPYN
jgi:predicted nucleic acid-binding protein